MALSDDLKAKVREIFVSKWTERDGQVVPAPESLKLGNDAVNLEAVCLYADMADSTDLVDRYKRKFSAEIFKTFLHCASKIIESEGGVITSFDGDRVMGIFIGNYKNTSAVNAGLKINHAVIKFVNPELKRMYETTEFKVKHAVGIDASPILAARTGVRGANDIVWVGTSANFAAKLSAIRQESYATFISERVYKRMDDKAKFGGNPRENMWERCDWNGATIYRSSWLRGVDA